MYSNTNPAELYPNTTWELLPNDKFIKTGATPLQQNGSNNISISKANLPAEKIQLESFQLGKGTQEITGDFYISNYNGYAGGGAFYRTRSGLGGHGGDSAAGNMISFQASRSWTGMSTSASPYTSQLGNGTPLTINPEHITIKAWKRLS